MESLIARMEWLAASLEEAVPLATTRVEHIRVLGHAQVARSLADGLRNVAAASVAP